jgi:glycosyltransferase involved in cell wall biosynthesis
MRFGVVLPARNESKALPNLISEIQHSIAAEYPNSHIEVLVVDDGSSDDTLQTVPSRVTESENFALTFISFTRNFGKEAAMYAGLSYFSGRTNRVVIMDADGQHPVSEMLCMLRQSVNSGFCVVGVQDHSTNGLLYKIANKVLHATVSPNDDASPTGTSDFRVLTEQAVLKFLELPERSRFSREIFDFLGLPTSYYQYTVEPRTDGTRSRWGRRNLFGYAITSITAKGPMVLPTLILASSAVVLVVTIYAIVVSGISISRGDYSGTASILFALVMFQIFQFIFLVFISSIVVAILIETKQRPLYVQRPPEISVE